MAGKNEIYIGTSGWVYKHWKDVFYPPEISNGSYLEFYNRKFRTVEINNSFYNLPEAETFDNWRKTTKKNFLFAVKASRYITHMKKLKESHEAVTNFLSRARHLREKLGPILFQLPPRWKVNTSRLETFLKELPRKFLYTFEFRDKSWFIPEVYEVLSEYNAAFCIYDLAGDVSPKEVTADFIYVRLHGPGDAYQGYYTPEQLAGWAGAFTTWQRQGKDIYCYFDNDQAGYAPKNALKLQDMLTKD